MSVNQNVDYYANLKIAIVAGEHSGDNCGAMLISKLKSLYPNSEFIGIGGPKMIAAGLTSIVDIEKLSIVGIFNIIKKLPELFLIKFNLINYLIKSKIDLYIGIDAPDFNLRVERKIKKISNRYNLNIKTIHYISPTVWAWRPKRIFKVAKATDTVLCIFPFEEEIYKNNNIAADFVGHPLIDKLNNINNFKTDIFKYTNNIDNIGTNSRLIGLLPGSRVSEIKQLTEIFLKAAVLINKKTNNNYNFVIPIVSLKIHKEFIKIYDNLVSNSILDKSIIDKIKIIKLYDNAEISSIDIIKQCDLILCSSGTTTLEACLLKTPMVVAYKVSKLNELLIRFLIKVNYIAMPNIISDKLYGRALVPEFVQKQVTPEVLSNSVLVELNKYYNNSTDNIQKAFMPWLGIESYLKCDNINHTDSVAKVIDKIIQEK